MHKDVAIRRPGVEQYSGATFGLDAALRSEVSAIAGEIDEICDRARPTGAANQHHRAPGVIAVIPLADRV
jgi:hypothetical protein